ncbi:MAG: hypothetical protein D6690_07050 [Nitrospirae bacterium]|nr:MAG: hypothetical protein D6690_07050 [Nitrospirota bacterium]
MNILILGFPILKLAFEQLGHSVKTCTTDGAGDLWVPEFPTTMDQLMKTLPLQWSPDAIVLMDESTAPMYLGLERLEMPVLWYTIDSHLHLHWHRAYSAVFDIVFVAQRDAVPHYVCDPSRQEARWLPLFCCPERDRPLALPKTHDVSFVGTIDDRWKPERSRWLRTLSRRIPLVIASGEYVTVFNRSKIVLNECAANDINFRVFEALACGSFLLTERVGNGFDDLFRDREHLVLYEKGEVDRLVELVDYYLHHESERIRIAQQGREAVLAAHTALHRAQSIVTALRSADLDAMVRARTESADRIAVALDAVYGFMAQMYAWAARRYEEGSVQQAFCARARAVFEHERTALHV